MNGQVRWDLYHAQQTEGDEMRQIRRHPGIITNTYVASYILASLYGQRVTPTGLSRSWLTPTAQHAGSRFQRANNSR